MDAFKLTDQGLPPSRFPEARERVEQIWRSRFGDAITTPGQGDGLEIDVIALALALAWEGLAAVYSAGFFRFASGVNVDLLLDLFGRKRLEATETALELVWYGSPSTSVALGATARNADTGVLFATLAAATIGTFASSLTWVVRIIAAAAGETYTVDVTGGASYNTVPGGGSTPTSIAFDLRDEINAGDDGIAAVAGTDAQGRALLIVDLDVEGELEATATTPANIDYLPAVRVAAKATITGPQPATAGTVTAIDPPLAGVTGVVNSADATIGRDRETDPEFKVRHLDTLETGSSTTAAIRAALLRPQSRGGAGATAVYVFENTTDAYDVVDPGERPGWYVVSIQVVDRFTDNGIVGVAITHTDDKVCEIDSFLLSCRVIARTVETALLSHLVAQAREQGAERIQGWFLPTKKNPPASNFYKDHGFEKIDEQDGGVLWSLDLTKNDVSCPEWIELVVAKG